MKLYPLKFDPLYMEKIWGGNNLERLFGRQLPAGKKIGESWEIADLPGVSSIVSNGPLAGKHLSELVTKHGRDLLGETGDGRFPVLLKILDANDVLSIQVHPDEAAAEKVGGNAVPKTECWYVLESRNGYMYKDLLAGTTREAFAEAIRLGEAEKLVRKIECKSGDFFYLPAGTIHALGKGVVVAEIQTPSDTTFRVSDWGRGREIHVEESLESINFAKPGKNEKAATGPPGTLLKSDHFSVQLKNGPAGTRAAEKHSVCICQMVLKGCGTVSEHVRFTAGDTILVPASFQEYSMEFSEDTEWLEITVPG